MLAIKSSSASQENIDDELKRSVVFLKISSDSVSGKKNEETGTGFIISKDGYMLSAHHLIAAPGVRVVARVGSRFGQEVEARIIPTGPSFADAVLLNLPGTLGPYVPVRLGNPRQITVGSRLYTIGFPLENDRSLADGVLSNKDGPQGLWQITVPLSYGNSGGPIAVRDSKVVGLVRGGITNAQLINFMIPNNLLAPLYIAAGITWPPYDGSIEDITPGPVQNLERTLSISRQDTQKCHEVVVVTGLPPVYSKQMECE